MTIWSPRKYFHPVILLFSLAIRLCADFLGVEPAFRLALLNSNDWRTLRSIPYGLPFVNGLNDPDPPSLWFSEYLASDCAFLYLHTVQPSMAMVWEITGEAILEAHAPAHHTLAEFEQLYNRMDVFPDLAGSQPSRSGTC